MKSKKKSKKLKSTTKTPLKPKKPRKKKNYYRKTVEQFAAESLEDTINRTQEAVEVGVSKLEAETFGDIFLEQNKDLMDDLQKLEEVEKQHQLQKLEEAEKQHQHTSTWIDSFFAIFGLKRKQ
jgi:hypothetical protein